MMKLLAFSAALAGCMVAMPLQATSALFCEGCTSEASAREEAQRHAPELQCSAPNPDEFMTPENQVCTSAAKKLVLANPNSRQLYTFVVGHEASHPWLVTVSSASLSAEESENYLKTIDFYNDFKQAVDATQQQLNKYAYRPPVAVSISADQCPENTALHTLISPEKMQGLEDWITYSIMKHSQEEVSDFFEFGGKVPGAGIPLQGADGTLGWSAATNRPFFIQGFQESEALFHERALPDALVFDMELKGFSGNVPVISFALSDASRVAGHTLPSFRGDYGGLTITNPCMLERLAQLRHVPGGEWRRPDGSPSDFGLEGGTPLPAGGEASLETCTIYFYQNGHLLYVFGVPMRQC